MMLHLHTGRHGLFDYLLAKPHDFGFTNSGLLAYFLEDGQASQDGAI